MKYDLMIFWLWFLVSIYMIFKKTRTQSSRRKIYTDTMNLINCGIALLWLIFISLGHKKNFILKSMFKDFTGLSTTNESLGGIHSTWCIGSALDCCLTGRALNPAAGVWFITKFISFSPGCPRPGIALTVQIWCPKTTVIWTNGVNMKQMFVCVCG